MATDYSAFLNDQDDDDQGMSAVRRALREADKARKEAEKRAEAYESKIRLNLVKEAGLKEAVVRYVPSDVVDKDSLETWLKSEEGSVFADSKSSTPVATPEAGEEEQIQGLEGIPPAMLEMFQRMSGVEAGADQRQLVGQSKAEAGLASLAGKDLSEKELMAAFTALDQGKVPGS